MRSRSFLILIIWGFIAVTTSAQPLRKALPVPDSSGQNYYAIDSDDPVTDPQWHPTYNFVDTTYMPNSWHRIYPGSQSIPASQPQAICWRGVDTTNNTFAGPMPVGFPFNFYGVNYDSVYLSSNGYIGFGNFMRASGGDGPAYSTFHCATFPDTLSPKSIAAFLMTDGEMVRSNQDSSRAFYRTNATNDSFFITFYNYFRFSDYSTNYFHHFRVDIQLVLAKADSSITFHYRRFNGAFQLGLESYSAETVFRNGCIPSPCTSNAAVIGLQNAARTAGTTYMSNGQFASPGKAAELHSGLAVKFKRWRNICRADSIVWPPPNWEIMPGDRVIPVATFRNVSSTPQTFYCLVRIRNIRTGLIMYLSRDSVVDLGANKSQRIIFEKWITDTDPFSGPNAATFIVEAIASPYRNGNEFIGDYWPGDDTLCQRLFEMEQMYSFSDFSNNFATAKLLPGNVPDPLKWVNFNAEVVDGDINTFSPPPPRGSMGDPSGVLLNSPVIKMDRLDANGFEYDHCAFGGVGVKVDDGGTGDTIISFPIDLHTVVHAVLGFSYERSGKKSYPRWYDLATVTGPERTITQPDTTQIYRYGDSLEVEFGDPSQTENITTWNEKLAIDGGKDFNFNRAYVQIDSSYCTNHFRFRVRLKAKNDFEPGNPSDDYDEWFLDNFVVVSPLKPEVEVSYARISKDWPYERVPASQAVAVPLEVGLANNGGLVGSAFGLAVIINDKNFVAQPGWYSGVYCRVITIPILAPGKSTIVNAGKWNARAAGPGQYSLSAFLLPKGYDSESQNDSTYFDFTMAFDSSYVYDNGSNDAPGFFQRPGIGIRLMENNPANPLGGGGDINSGSIATKFVVYQRDTLLGTQLWFGSNNQEHDAIRITLYKSQNEIPGDTLAIGCNAFSTVRSTPWDDWSVYRFPCGPIVLDPGEYWMSVSQLGQSWFELGVSAYKSSCDWKVYDPSPNLNHVFVVNYSQMINKFAYENTLGSNSWFPFYFPAGIGKAGYSYGEGGSAYGKKSVDCNRNYNYFHAQGSWIPMIRPYFGLRTWGPQLYDTLYTSPSSLAFSRRYLSFGSHISCNDSIATLMDSIQVTSPIQYGHGTYTLSWHIVGKDASDFVVVGISSKDFVPGTSADIVVQCKAVGNGKRTATLVVNTLSTCFNDDSIPLTYEYNDGIIGLPSDTVQMGRLPLGYSLCFKTALSNTGTIPDTIESVTITPDNPAIFISKVPATILGANSTDTLVVCFAAYDTGVKTAVVTIKSNPCNRVRTIFYTGTAVNFTGVETPADIPITVKLSPNRPNPFADETTIDFDIAQSGHTRLIITDMLGRVCAVISDEHLPAGHYSKKFSGGMSLAGGMYVCVLECNGVVVRRMVDVAR